VNALRAVGGIVVAVSLGGCGLDLIYADWKVDQLCKKDGGITVYRHDVLPEQIKLPTGAVNMLALERAKVGDDYYFANTTTAIEPREPEIKRLEALLIRHKDGALLGKSVSYVRPTQNIGVPIFHSAAHVCPQGKSVATMVSQVFAIEKR